MMMDLVWSSATQISQCHRARLRFYFQSSGRVTGIFAYMKATHMHIFYAYEWLACMYVCMYTTCVFGVHRSKKREDVGSPELEVWVVVNHCVDTGN